LIQLGGIIILTIAGMAFVELFENKNNKKNTQYSDELFTQDMNSEIMDELKNDLNKHRENIREDF